MHPLDSGPLVGKHPHVLIAEDDDVTRAVLQHWFLKWRYEITLAKNGADAWDILQQENPPELVVIDWSMPGKTGIELSRMLRDKSRPYYHYILMITGKTDRNSVIRALKSGADDCLSKPLDQGELKARLIVANRILTLQNQLIHAREKHRERATKDVLTGLWNRAAFLDLFQREMDRARRSQTPTGLLILDLDHFKKVNDTYGHLTGDAVLREAARRLKKSVRSYDIVGRLGGEEFIIVLPAVDRVQLRKRAEAIRLAFSTEPFQVDGEETQITTSIGAAVVAPAKTSTSKVMTVADIALYRAKDGGRNRVVYCELPWQDTLQAPMSLRTSCDRCKLQGSAACVVSDIDSSLKNRSVLIGSDTDSGSGPQVA